jgi:two-component system cell cycle response regulator
VAATPVDVGGHKVPVTISVGVTSRRAQDTDVTEPIRLADRALHAAKAGGRNRLAVDPGTGKS